MTAPDREPRRYSPCTGVCSATALGDLVCRGCGRTSDEVTQWNSMSPDERDRVWARLESEDRQPMTTRFVCPRHGPVQPGQVVHYGRHYSCSSCGSPLRSESSDPVAELQRQVIELREHVASAEMQSYRLTAELAEARRQLAMMRGA